MAPDLLHIVPVGHNSALDGIIQSEKIPHGLSRISNVGVQQSKALVTRTTHDGWNDPPVDGICHQRWKIDYIIIVYKDAEIKKKDFQNISKLPWSIFTG